MKPESRLAQLAPRYDLIVIGGGITGAGVLREAVRTGASVLLVDQADFASGTSSWSSKLVHGGLRYLQSGDWRLTLESVRERTRLLREAPGLVQVQPFLMPLHRGARPGRALMQSGLLLYDLMAGRRSSRWVRAEQLLQLEPALASQDLLGAMRFDDAQTDDARLVQRLIEDSRAAGATALNYVQVTDLMRQREPVTGVVLLDAMAGDSRQVEAAIVVNATGVWARQFAPATVSAPTLRPLRGSHFLFEQNQLPISHAISWLHPHDRRPVFAYPWEGAVLYGTTDLDHDVRAPGPVRMSADESVYLIEALNLRFPSVNLGASDALCSYAGVRPVVAGGKNEPSAESRESALWSSPGLVSITGGKLTTFRTTARQVLAEAARQWACLAPRPPAPLFDGVPGDPSTTSRLGGRFGLAYAARMTAAATPAERECISGTPYTWAELRWSARYEQVLHLEDLLMRRTRIGLLCREGGRALLPRLRQTVQADLGWDDARWTLEEAAYCRMWQHCHAPE